MRSISIEDVDHKIAIMSGKGGVGKSTIAANLSIALARLNKRVGILDSDFHGPSIPRILGVKGEILKGDKGRIEPVLGPLGVRIVSIGLIVREGSPIIWRAPLKVKALLQLLEEVEWGEIDYLVIDLPPGTGDESLTIMQMVKDLDGVLIVTNPSQLSGEVVSRSLSMARRLSIRILGIVENMSYFRCPRCGNVSRLFGKALSDVLAEEYDTRVLARIPFSEKIAEGNDLGRSVALGNDEEGRVFVDMARRLMEVLENAR